MRLRDMLYLRFFLFHQRYGRFWAAMIEGVCVFIAALVIGLFLFGLSSLFLWWWNDMLDEHTRVYKAEAAGYQSTLIRCLNGGIIGKAGDEVIMCEHAVTFKFGRLK